MNKYVLYKDLRRIAESQENMVKLMAAFMAASVDESKMPITYVEELRKVVKKVTDG